MGTKYVSLISTTVNHVGGSPEIVLAGANACSHMTLAAASYMPVSSSERVAMASSHGALCELNNMDP